MIAHSVRTLVYGLMVCVWVGLRIDAAYVEAQPKSPADVVNRLHAALRGEPVSDPKGMTKKSHMEALELIDVSGISQRLLGKHWAHLSLDAQHEFITLFGDLLMDIAFPQSAGFLNDLGMPVVNERLDGSQAVVATILQHPEEGNISIDYLLAELDGQWRIQDIEMDGASLSRNLRAKFNRIIAHSSYPELVQRMRKTLAKQ